MLEGGRYYLGPVQTAARQLQDSIGIGCVPAQPGAAEDKFRLRAPTFRHPGTLPSHGGYFRSVAEVCFGKIVLRAESCYADWSSRFQALKDAFSATLDIDGREAGGTP